MNRDFDDDCKSVRSNLSKHSKHSVKSNASKDSYMQKSIQRSQSQVDKFKSQLNPNESKHFIDKHKKSRS